MLAPFYALQPIAATNETVPYPDVAHASGSGVTDPVCQRGPSYYSIPIGLQTFNIETNRAVYTLFAEMVNKYPASAWNESVVQFEGYAQQGVRAVDPDSTAYAHRGDSLLACVSLSSLRFLTPHSDAQTAKKFLRRELAYRPTQSRCRGGRLWRTSSSFVPQGR